VDIHEDESLKYWSRIIWKDNLNFTRYCRNKSRRNCSFIDAEAHFDNYAEKLGVDIENLIISQPDNGEQAKKCRKQFVLEQLIL
jgi:hypothetical protein